MCDLSQFAGFQSHQCVHSWQKGGTFKIAADVSERSLKSESIRIQLRSVEIKEKTNPENIG